MAAEPPVLDVSGLSVEYLTGGDPVRAVENVSFILRRGEFLGLVGESGCGKSTLCFAIGRLLGDNAEITGGEIRFAGKNLVHLREKQLRHLRWKELSVVMQSAMNALNPVISIGEHFVDTLQAHEPITTQAARKRAGELLSMVGIDTSRLDSFPHELSGGMRQRVVIALALALGPQLIIMDEPTTALDVVVQREILQQIQELQQKLGFAVLFITHDLSLLVEFCHRIAIMYAGEIVEEAPAETLFRQPKHPYTVGLMSSFPALTGEKRRITGIPGSPPDLSEPPPGCRFAPRCKYASACAFGKRPLLRAINSGHLVACHRYGGAA